MLTGEARDMKGLMRPDRGAATVAAPSSGPELSCLTSPPDLQVAERTFLSTISHLFKI
jgi:hypothetical protein